MGMQVVAENALAEKKVESAAALDAYVDSALKANEVDEATTAKIEEVRASGKQAIENATSESAVQTALDNAKASVDEIINASKTPAGGETK